MSMSNFINVANKMADQLVIINEEIHQLQDRVARTIVMEKSNIKWSDVIGLGMVKEALIESFVMPNKFPLHFTTNPGKLLTPEDVLSILNNVSRELSHTMKTPNMYASTLTLRYYIDGLMLVEVCAKENIDLQDMLEYLETKLTFTHLGKGLEKVINDGREEYIKNSTRTYIS